MKLVAAHGLPFQTQDSVPAGEKSNGQSRLCTPDLLFREIRIAIFMDGCYWHRCKTHGPNDSRAAQIRAKDASITACLEAAGWLVLRYWEHESIEAAADAILSSVHERYSAQKAIHRIPVLPTCRHRKGNWCGLCAYQVHGPVPGPDKACARCGTRIANHQDEAVESICQDWRAVAYDAGLISLRLNECLPVSAAEMREVADAATRLAVQMVAAQNPES